MSAVWGPVQKERQDWGSKEEGDGGGCRALYRDFPLGQTDMSENITFATSVITSEFQYAKYHFLLIELRVFVPKPQKIGLNLGSGSSCSLHLYTVFLDQADLLEKSLHFV